MNDVEILRPLVDDVIERASEPSQYEGAALFSDLNALRPVRRAPVAVCHELIPDAHWVQMLGAEPLKCRDDGARALEWRLRRALWADKHICDDRPLFAQVFVHAALRQVRGWGVELSSRSVGDSRTASKPIPTMADCIDVSRLTVPEYEHDDAETRRRVEQVTELVEGRLDIATQTPHLGLHMFDVATSMRGMDNLLLDCALEPGRVHELMTFITEALRRTHLWREQAGLANAPASPCGSFAPLDWAFYHCAWHPTREAAEKALGAMNCAPTGLADGVGARFIAPTEERQRACRGSSTASLADEWAYTSAQTSAGLGPKQFEEFVFPYNARVSELFSRQTVYFHGCEKLDDKFEALRALPNLRRIHVSPWSSVSRAREVFGRSVVLEVHAHPTSVFFTDTRETMRDDLRRLLHEAGDCRLDLNLNDIHSFNDNPTRLGEWADLAREVSDEFGER